MNVVVDVLVFSLVVISWVCFLLANGVPGIDDFVGKLEHQMDPDFGFLPLICCNSYIALDYSGLYVTHHHFT